MVKYNVLGFQWLYSSCHIISYTTLYCTVQCTAQTQCVTNDYNSQVGKCMPSGKFWLCKTLFFNYLQKKKKFYNVFLTFLYNF